MEFKQSKNANEPQVRRCVYCGSKSGIVWVHGHGQCAHCGINVEECCRGETEGGRTEEG